MQAKKIRNANKHPKQKQPCYVCNKFNGITEWHHVTPISSIKDEYEYWIGEEIQMVCLCPNCHAVIHKLFLVSKIKDLKKRCGKMAELFEGYSNQEFGKFMEVAGMNKNG